MFTDLQMWNMCNFYSVSWLQYAARRSEMPSCGRRDAARLGDPDNCDGLAGRYLLRRPEWRGGLAVSGRHQGMATREIVGWSIADHLRAELVCDALLIAIR